MKGLVGGPLLVGGLGPGPPGPPLNPALPHPIYKKISPDFCVSHRPHWAAQGGPDPWTPLASYAAGQCIMERTSVFSPRWQLSSKYVSKQAIKGADILDLSFCYLFSACGNCGCLTAMLPSQPFCFAVEWNGHLGHLLLRSGWTAATPF